MRACELASVTKRAFLLGPVASLWWVGLDAHAAQTVTVRNAQLKVMKELRTRAELDEFHRYWGARQPIPQTTDNVRDWAFTLDVVQQGHAQRWLYQSNGMAAKVDSRVQTVYQLKNPAAFNALIGAPKY